MRGCMGELVHLLKAKVQVVWIDSYEEYEVLKDIKEIVANFPGMKLFTWSFTEGKKRIALSSKEEQQPPEKCPIDRIFVDIGDAQDNKDVQDEAIFILKDLHLINDDHKVKRALRDIKERPSKNYNPIIIVAPSVNIPIEWEKLVTVLHYDTPNKTEIRQLVEAMNRNIQKAINDGKTEYRVINEVEKRQIVDACIGLTYNQIVDTLFKSMTKYKQLSLKAVMEEKIQLVEKSGVLDYKVPDARFEDIGGNETFKEWVEEIEMAMSDDAKAFSPMSIRPKGYVALGVPGTAKTYSAEAMAAKWGVPLLQLNMSKIMNKLVGESEKKIEQAFRIAEACAPCIFLIDEVEKALSGTRSSNSSDAGTTSRVFSSVLQFLAKDNGVFTIMTSNDISQLPPELTRTGRIDAMWYFSLPNIEERRSIFRIHLAKTGKTITDELVEAGAAVTQNYTGAEIKEIVKIALRKAYKRFKEDGNGNITDMDLVSAVRSIIPIYESSKERINYLEQWVVGRARYTNGRIDQEGFDTGRDDEVIRDLVLSDLK